MMENKDLKEQFLLLQAQQQQKLLERRRKKEEANRNKADGTNNKQNVSGALDVNDDLGLKTVDSVLPDRNSSCVSEELVDHLNDQIRQMKDENGRLYKLLSEKDFEIRQVKKKIEEKNNNFVDGGVTNETAATKIIELSKKIRELTSEKEAEKTRCKQFQKKLHDLQLQMQLLPPPSEVSALTASVISLQASTKDDDAVDVKALQDRLKQSEARATDLRNHCQSLRQDLKVAHKVLSQEIGENVNFQTLLNETSNWRGRAQQIIALQLKIDELKGQLDGSTTDGSTNNNEKASGVKRKQEERYREELRRMDKERKEAQENAASKLKSLEAENQSTKEKLEAAKARNKVLSNEIKSLKAQVETLLRKSRNDDEFIDALMKQQSQMKQLLDSHSQQQAQQQNLQQQQLHQMSMKSQQDSNVVEQLKAIATQKESQVNMLEMELQHLKMVHMQNHNPNNMFSSLPAPATATTPSGNNWPPTASATDVLNSRQSDLTNSALSSARSRSLSRMSRPASTPEEPVAVQSCQHELIALRYQYKEMEVIGQATEVERDKMKELVKVLQGRLTEETQRLSDTMAEIQALKRQTVELEKKLARRNLDASKRKGASKVLKSTHDDSVDDGSCGTHMDQNELLARLEIQKDENESLRTALQQTLKAKEEDLSVYSTTLEETKKVFLQALRQMKGRQAIS